MIPDANVQQGAAYLSVVFQWAHIHGRRGNDYLRSEALQHGLETMNFILPSDPVLSNWHDAPLDN